MNLFAMVCPSCGVEHDVKFEDYEVEDEDFDPEDCYDGLCPKCEVEWVGSDEYALMLENLYNG